MSGKNMGELYISLKRYIRKLTENRIPASIVLLVPSVIIFYLSLGQQVWHNIMTKDMVDYATNTFGNWSIIFLMITPITILIGAYYLIDTIKAKKYFKENIDINSKVMFRRNLEELEKAATKLPDRYWDLLEEKKKKFKL